jgi:hypothetical protein
MGRKLKSLKLKSIASTFRKSKDIGIWCFSASTGIFTVFVIIWIAFGIRVFLDVKPFDFIFYLIFFLDNVVKLDVKKSIWNPRYTLAMKALIH